MSNKMTQALAHPIDHFQWSGLANQQLIKDSFGAGPDDSRRHIEGQQHLLPRQTAKTKLRAGENRGHCELPVKGRQGQ
jgi:hypothetical protein